MKSGLIRIVVVFLILFSASVFAQSVWQTTYNKYTPTHNGIPFTLYDFSRAMQGNKRIKAKYFAQNAYSRYQSWKSGKEVLLVCSGAFSTDWSSSATPIGLCVDNGSIVNQNIHTRDAYGNDLDALVIVYGGGADAGGVVVKDIEKDNICVSQGESACYNVKTNSSDRYKFTQWAVSQSATVFQLPLMYTSTHGKSYGSLYYGDPKERRFLAICIDNNGTVHHMVIDTRQKVYMNYCAEQIVNMLQGSNYKVIGLLTLDTGGKDILYEYWKGSEYKVGPTEMSEATNLLVYYVD